MEQLSTDVFDNIGFKKVTKTDKEKGAFVLNIEQKAVMAAAGYFPGTGGESAVRLDIFVPDESPVIKLDVSYYDSVREGADRKPETRMGRDIVHWMQEGDDIALGNIGEKVFVWKVGRCKLSLNDIANNFSRIAGENILDRARKATGTPNRIIRSVSDFQRNTAVVAGALTRSNGKCEMPGCGSLLFKRGDGTVFLEVHHIEPLAEGGEDTMINAAALCPMCHRELHFGEQRSVKRELLRVAVRKLEF